ncbi:MAG: hypothetical protein ACRC57_03315 [Sarcina sp.]
MNKGIENIEKNLENGEKIIFNTNKNFKFGEKNTLVAGDKIFCISNLGRIFIADKSKWLGIKKIYTYDYKKENKKFNVMTKENIIAINSREFTDNRVESFIINLKLDDFVNLYNNLEENPFIIIWEKLVVKVNNKIYETVDIELEENKMLFKSFSYEFELEYKNILGFKEGENNIDITTNDEEYSSVIIQSFNKDISILKDKIKSNKKIQIIKKNENTIDQTQIMDYEEIEKCLKEYSTESSKNSENSENSENSDEETISKFYKEEIENKIEVKNIGISLDDKIQENMNLETEKNLKLKGLLYGTINFMNYNEKNIEIINSEKDFIIIDSDINKKILEMKKEEVNYKCNSDILILEYKNNVILIELKNNDIENNFIIKEKEENRDILIGYTMEKKPFKYYLNHNNIEFKQDEKILLTLDKNNLADINILENDKNNDFDIIAVTIMDSTIYKFYIDKHNTKHFIKDLYKIKSCEYFSNLENINLKNIYLESKKDELIIELYSYFIEIRDILDENSIEEKNKKEIIVRLNSLMNKGIATCEIIEMYYLEDLNLNINNIDIDIISLFSSIINKLKKNFKGILSEIDEFKISNCNDFYINKVSMDLQSKIIKKQKINCEYIKYDELYIKSNLNNTEFEEFIVRIKDKFNMLSNIYNPYYIRIIKDIFVYIKNSKLTFEKNNMIDYINEYFIDMQLIKYNNKKGKDILEVINKEYLYKDDLEKDILNLINF